MSRSYLLYAEWQGMSEDEVWSLLVDWCGHHQIFKVDWDDGRDEGFVYVEMGCSAGAKPLDKMRYFKAELLKRHCEGIYMKCWSLHPDAALHKLN